MLKQTNNSKRVKMAIKVAEEQGKIYSHSIMTTILTIESAIMKVPGENDPFLKLINANEFFIPEDESIKSILPVVVPEHYRRGDIIEGKMLTRNFYVSKETLGRKILAKVTIKEKRNLYDGKKKIIFDIVQITDQTIKPKCLIKIGIKNNKRPINGERVLMDKGKQLIIIPGSEKFVSVEEIAPR